MKLDLIFFKLQKDLPDKHELMVYIQDRPGIRLIPSVRAFIMRSVIIFPCYAESDFLSPFKGFS